MWTILQSILIVTSISSLSFCKGLCEGLSTNGIYVCDHTPQKNIKLPASILAFFVFFVGKGAKGWGDSLGGSEAILCNCVKQEPLSLGKGWV